MVVVDRIAAVLDEMFARGVGSGAALSIGDGGQEVERMVRGSTRRLPTPGVPISAETWFDVASLTKPMVTVASAMVLVGEGVLDLDAPIRRWLPHAASTGTVGQLLGHAAGCAAHVEFWKRLRMISSYAGPRADLVAQATAHPATEPGVATIYSDLGYIMLGAILERAANACLEDVFLSLVAEPLGLDARFVPQAAPLPYPRKWGPTPLPDTADKPVAATELDEHGFVIEGRVHDENARFGGGVCGHAGLFARIGDVATFAAAFVDTAAGQPRGRLRTDVVNHFLSTSAAPDTSWRLGWDTPSATPGVSTAGDRWPRVGAVGHLGFTGVSLWLDLPRRRWVTLLTNRVHPTRFGESAEVIKAVRRQVNDLSVGLLETRA